MSSPTPTRRVSWRIYYDDGSTYSEDDGSPALAPKQGVQVIRWQGEDGPGAIHSRDYYWWTGDDTWYGGDVFGLWDQLTQPGAHVVLFGRSVPSPEFREILARALDEEV